MKLKTALLAVIVSLAPTGVRAEGTAGAQPFDFLFLDANARSVGMGGAYTALASDSNALLYNPAGLGRIQRHEVTLMHGQYVQGLTHEYLGLGLRQGFGLNLSYLHFGDLKRTTYSTPDGSLGRFAIDDTAAGVGYGHTFLGVVSLGGAAKYIAEKNDNVVAKAYAFDAGAMVSIPAVPKLTLGLAAQNMGPPARFLHDRERLPVNLRGGISYSGVNDLTFAFDVMKQRQDHVRFAGGAEALIAKVMAVRGGFSSRNDAGIGITAGVGWNWRDLSIDYAFVPYGDLGITHRASVTFRWGKFAESYEDDDGPRRAEPERKRSAWKRSETEVASEAPMYRPPVQRHLEEETADDHFAKARRLIDLRAYAEAAVELGLAQKLLEPEDRRLLRAYERMGFIALQQREVARAKSLYLEGLKLAGSLGLSDPYVADAYEGLGHCLMAQGDAANALRAFKKAQEVSPSIMIDQLIEETKKELKRRRGRSRQ